ncbi:MULTISPECIES: DUF4334 domain-containing protein [Actinoplanes]|uniref:GXWXG domain-containing protein n=2 Tax=Actinoplanes TaxID=1865 RepID=A0A101JM75_9ACTN|nr:MULTISPECIES: DUF4334 domain-containing protein [Actinoplanes]KUL29208.1 hypothetical protein ADL15_29050 [Actinoplanes awajinensis subsp. mycoplanecinus]GIE64309.1 hypothetical protein Apa02nite_004170 [Actinoplanes palleronii]
MDADQARARLGAGDKFTFDELDEIWAALPTVRPEEILGAWRGSEFVTGHRFEGTLARIDWYGKIFTSLTDVSPIVCRRPDGALYDNIEMAKGRASLWTVEFRGEPTATMIYDGQPVLDHFKRAGEHTLLGVMNGKGVRDQGRYYYFRLDRDPG